MAALKDWVRAEVSVGGTGALTVTNVADWPAFNDSTTLDEEFSYAILSEEFAPLERGVGKRTGSNAFERVMVLATYVGTLEESSPSPADIPVGAILLAVLSVSDFGQFVSDGDLAITNAAVSAINTDAAFKTQDNIFEESNRFKQTTCPPTTLTYAASLQPNLAAGQAHVVTAAGNATLNQPLGEDGSNFQSFQLEFIQDATGGRTLGFNTTFYEAGSASFPVVTSTANRKTVLLFNRQSNGKYLVIAINDVRST